MKLLQRMKRSLFQMKLRKLQLRALKRFCHQRLKFWLVNFMMLKRKESQEVLAEMEF